MEKDEAEFHLPPDLTRQDSVFEFPTYDETYEEGEDLFDADDFDPEYMPAGGDGPMEFAEKEFDDEFLPAGTREETRKRRLDLRGGEHSLVHGGAGDGGVVVDKRRSGSEETILRSIHYPLHLMSTKALSLDTNGSVASFDIKDAPLHIPNQATEVYAKLLYASIPYDWSIPQEGSVSDTIPTDANFEVDISRAPSFGARLLTATVTATFSDASTRQGTSTQLVSPPNFFRKLQDLMNSIKRHANDAARAALPYEEDLFDVYPEGCRLYLAKQPFLHDTTTTSSLSDTLTADASLTVTHERRTHVSLKGSGVTPGMQVRVDFSDSTNDEVQNTFDRTAWNSVDEWMQSIKSVTNKCLQDILPYEDELFDIHEGSRRLYLAKQPTMHDSTTSTDTITSDSTFTVQTSRATTVVASLTSVTVTATFDDASTRAETYTVPSTDPTTFQNLESYLGTVTGYVNKAARKALPYEEDLFDFHAKASEVYLAKKPFLHDEYDVTNNITSSNTTMKVVVTRPRRIKIKQGTQVGVKAEPVGMGGTTVPYVTVRINSSSTTDAEVDSLANYMQLMLRALNRAASVAGIQPDIFVLHENDDPTVLGENRTSYSFALKEQPSKLHESTGLYFMSIQIIEELELELVSTVFTRNATHTMYNDSISGITRSFPYSYNAPATERIDVEETITIPAGRYTKPEEIQTLINQASNIPNDNIRVEALEGTKQWTVSAKVGSPHKYQATLPIAIHLRQLGSELQALLNLSADNSMVHDFSLTEGDGEQIVYADIQSGQSTAYSTELSTLKVSFSASSTISYGYDQTTSYPSETTIYDKSDEFQSDAIAFGLPYMHTYAVNHAVLKAGDYRTASSLQAALNAALALKSATDADATQQENTIEGELIRVRAFDEQKKWQIGALLAQDPVNYPRTPEKITVTTSDAEIKALLGWPSGTNSITLYGRSTEPEVVYDDNSFTDANYLTSSAYTYTTKKVSQVQVRFITGARTFGHGNSGDFIPSTSYTTVYDTSDEYTTDFLSLPIPHESTYTQTITIEAGNYRNPIELEAAMNASLLSTSTIKHCEPLFKIRSFDDMQKWQLGALLTSDTYTNPRTPKEVTVATTNAELKSLLGWATTTTSITLTGTQIEPTVAYDTNAFTNTDYRTSSAYTTAPVTARTLSTLKISFNALGNIEWGSDQTDDGEQTQAWPSETTVYDSSDEFQTDYVDFDLPLRYTYRYTLTLKTGNYRTPLELQAALNAALTEKEVTIDNVIPSLLRVRAFDGLQKWQLGIFTSTDYLDYVTFETSDANLKSLLGWKQSTSQVTLHARDTEPTAVYDPKAFTDANYRTSSAYDTATPASPDTIKSLYIETNFTNAGVNTLASPSRTLAMVPITATHGNYIHFAPSIESRVHCGHNLMGDSHTELEFRIVDQDHNPIVFQNPSTKPWTLQVEVEWQEAMTKDRTDPSPTETKFR